MLIRTTIICGALVAACGLVAITTGSPSADAGTGTTRWQALTEIRQLQADFHGSATSGDLELLRSLWADDATVSAAGSMFHGTDEIVAFFSSSPNWGISTSLAPSFKTQIHVFGNVAMLQFECIIVRTGDLDALTTPLSTIPFGAQNPEVEIVQHSTATCMAVKEHGEWKIKLFAGSAGPKS